MCMGVCLQGCVYSVNYLRQVDGCVQWGVNSVTYIRQVGIWQPDCVYSVSYLWQGGACLHGVCALTVKYRTLKRDLKRNCVDDDIKITVNPTIDTKENTFLQKNNNIIMFLLNKILYFRAQVKKFDNEQPPYIILVKICMIRSKLHAYKDGRTTSR